MKRERYRITIMRTHVSRIPKRNQSNGTLRKVRMGRKLEELMEDEEKNRLREKGEDDLTMRKAE